MRIFSVVIASLVFASTVSAQEYNQSNPLNLAIGDRIQVRNAAVSNDMLFGTVTQFDGDQIVYTVTDSPNPIALRYAAIDTIAVQRSIPRESAILGAAWGGFLGGAAGAVSGPFAAGGLPMSTGSSIAALSIGGAIGGALIGGAVGAVLAPARWYRHVMSH